MTGEVLNLDELARYLSRDARELQQLADRGALPGRKVGGNWRFARAEVVHWVETQMHLYSDGELTTLEGNPEEAGLLVSAHLPEACVALPMNARSKRSALEELVSAAERSWHVYDPDAILTALIQREESHATALENGVAIPHPRRSPTGALGDTVIAFGRSFAGIPFGGTRGRLTDLFFLVCSKDDHTHLKILARLSRMMLRPNFLEQLRLADSPDEAYQTILATEREVARG